MSLYDPDRSRAVRGADNVETWDAFPSALRAQMEKEHVAAAAPACASSAAASPRRHCAPDRRSAQAVSRRRAGTATSRYPTTSQWRARRLAFGRPLTALPRFADAAVVLALDADSLGAGPAQIGNARGFADGTQGTSAPDRFLRLYAVEPNWTADRRQCRPPAGTAAGVDPQRRPRHRRAFARRNARISGCRRRPRDSRTLAADRSRAQQGPRAGPGGAGAAGGGARALPLDQRTRSRRRLISSSRSIRTIARPTR